MRAFLAAALDARRAWCFWLPALIAVAIATLGPAPARDLGQWKDNDPAISAWFGHLMQPDTIGMGGGVSCCGESDGYWADEVHVRDGKTYAVITDDRDDGPLMRQHEDIGTEYVVPPNKIVSGQGGNPTGHVIIFLGGVTMNGATRMQPRQVLCYVMNGGV